MKLTQSFINQFLVCLIFISAGSVMLSCQDHDKKTLVQKQVSTPSSQANSRTPLFSLNTDTIPNDRYVPLFYEGQLCHWVRGIVQDSKGMIWMGTNHYGVMRYDGTKVSYFEENDGVGGGRINKMVEDEDGTMWFCTYGGLTKYDGETFTNYPIETGSIKNDVWSVEIDDNGMFWVGTLEGVVQFDGATFTPFLLPKPDIKTPNPILSGNRITSIIEDKKGKLWFGTDGYGICTYNGKTFEHFTTKEGLADNNISELMEDSKGNIWIGTMFGGLSKYDGNSFTNFTKDGSVNEVEVGGLYEDKKGGIWFAAENQGVFRYDGSSFVKFDENDCLVSNGILSIYEDTKGRFWFGGWKGLSRFNGTSFTEVTKSGPWD